MQITLLFVQNIADQLKKTEFGFLYHSIIILTRIEGERTREILHGMC